MLKSLLIAAALALGLAGCATATSGAKTPAQRVFALQADYNAALNLAVAYESQPRCTPVLTSGCSSLSIVVEIRRADDAAYAAVKGAQNTVRTPGTSESTMELAMVGAANSIGALRTVLRTYKIGS